MQNSAGEEEVTVANSLRATATNAALAANTAAKLRMMQQKPQTRAAELSKDQIAAVGRYIGNEVTPAAEAAIQAAKAINEAANNAAGSIVMQTVQQRLRMLRQHEQRER